MGWTRMRRTKAIVWSSASKNGFHPSLERVQYVRMTRKYWGTIDKASEAQKRAAYMETTNDRNESELGTMRQQKRRNPNMSLNTHNARQMYKRNKTSEYLRGLGSRDV